MSTCSKCSKPVLSHTLCENCGTYKGREVINVFEKLNKKEKKAKEKEIKEEGSQKGELSMEGLSKK